MKKNLVLLGTLLLVLASVNMMVARKEATLTHGQTMLLQLAPVDPRSLMQGDYMVLRYAIAAQVPKKDFLPSKGCLVVSLNKDHVASFARIHQGEPLQAGEHLLVYRNRGGLRLGAESFLFQEGDAKLYSAARYGELKVDESGTSMLVGLRDDQLRPLGRNTVIR